MLYDFPSGHIETVPIQPNKTDQPGRGTNDKALHRVASRLDTPPNGQKYDGIVHK